MKLLYKYFPLVLFVAFFFSCARLGQPPGGPKDELPPVALKSKPENYATNYSRKNIFIKFDEWVKLKDIYTEFTLSPPLEETPVPRLKGKGVFTELDYRELDTVTYTLDFGQSITDLNEGNAIPSFQFVVSKQAHIDSFSLSGYALDAFTLKPNEDGIFVQLYRSAPDTAAFSTWPSYLGKTNTEGYFEINHIAPGTYGVFALIDFNANMLFDLPNEVIAFSNDPIYLYPDSFPAKPDTLLQVKTKKEHEHFKRPETIKDKKASDEAADKGIEFSAQGESIQIDTADLPHNKHEHFYEPDSLELMVYGYSIYLLSFLEEPPYNQLLAEYERDEREFFQLIFNEPLDTLPEITLLKPDTIGSWYLLEASANKDTLNYWLADSNMVNTDSIIVAARYPRTDTSGMLKTVNDTLRFILKSKEKKEERKKGVRLFGNKDDEKEVDTLPIPVPRLKYSHNINSSAHDLNVPLIITPEVPAFDYRKEQMQLVRMEDTIEVPVNFNISFDSSSFRRCRIDLTYESDTRYILKLFEGAFFDIYGRTIDSSQISFKTQRDDFYGKLELRMSGINSPTIVQLIDNKETIIKKTKISANEAVVFSYLKAGNYMVKLIIDNNDNNKWDTGKYLDGLQPEKVLYFPQEIEIKPNSFLEFDWELE